VLSDELRQGDPSGRAASSRKRRRAEVAVGGPPGEAADHRTLRMGRPAAQQRGHLVGQAVDADGEKHLRPVVAVSGITLGAWNRSGRTR